MKAEFSFGDKNIIDLDATICNEDIDLQACFGQPVSQYVTQREFINATKTFIFEQAIPSDEWTIHHNLNRQISSIIIVNSANEIVVPEEIILIDINTVMVTFLAGFAGKAYIR